MATRNKPVDLIVRRGALRRFHKLRQRIADVPVRLSWDRREYDRRSAAGRVDANRRTNERRQKPPFTWELSDFVVVTELDDTST